MKIKTRTKIIQQKLIGGSYIRFFFLGKCKEKEKLNSPSISFPWSKCDICCSFSDESLGCNTLFMCNISSDSDDSGRCWNTITRKISQGHSTFAFRNKTSRYWFVLLVTKQLRKKIIFHGFILIMKLITELIKPTKVRGFLTLCPNPFPQTLIFLCFHLFIWIFLLLDNIWFKKFIEMFP